MSKSDMTLEQKVKIVHSCLSYYLYPKLTQADYSQYEEMRTSEWIRKRQILSFILLTDLHTTTTQISVR